MRYCGKCGFDNAAALQTPPRQPAPPMVTCSKCSKSYASTLHYCPYCGDKYIACPNCKADLEDPAKPCPHCGYTPPAVCKQCGAVLDDAAMTFCGVCGTKIK